MSAHPANLPDGLTEIDPHDASWLDTYEDITLREAARHRRPFRPTDEAIQRAIAGLVAMHEEQRRAIAEGRPWK